jgi:hypothetical protein
MNQSSTENEYTGNFDLTTGNGPNFTGVATSTGKSIVLLVFRIYQ